MKKLFYLGLIGIILYEVAKVYFIMPMPGSQRMNSIDLAYFLHSWRWVFRIVFWGMILFGSLAAFQSKRKWIPALFLFLAVGLSGATNLKMSADTMFYQPNALLLANPKVNKVSPDRLVIGVSLNGEAKAYPIQYIGYHHQVRDVLGGKSIMVTYCTVCRTGRVFEPIVNGQEEKFRLVGMDHFNAMFEDEKTGSWWRQVNGEAIVGPLKGKELPELFSTQTSLGEWLKLYPQSKIMQPDPEFQAQYDNMEPYESGKSKSSLTRADSIPWTDKAWVVGVLAGNKSKAFDWKRLEKEKVINEQIGTTPVAIILGGDGKSFFAYERLPKDLIFMRNDTLFQNGTAYNLIGDNLDKSGNHLKRMNAYQEYWHSWNTFHPDTEKY